MFSYNISFIINEEVFDMINDNNKKGYSCLIKNHKRFEAPKEKIARYKLNIISIYKRAKYGFCDIDVWNIDDWFLSVMPAMLEQLKENLHGYPVSEEVDVHATGEPGIDIDCEDDGMKKWKAILEEMIFMLREADEDTCSQVNPYAKPYTNIISDYLNTDSPLADLVIQTKPFEIAAIENKEHPEHTDLTTKYLVEDVKLNKYRNDCKNRALELFTKWFWNLWD